MVSGHNQPGRLRWQEHVGVLLAVVSTGFLSLVLLGVSHGSTETAFEILRSIGTASMAFGLVIRILPGLLMILFTLVLPVLRRGVIPMPSKWLLAIVVVPLALVTPVVFLAVMAALVPLSLWVYKDNPEERPSEKAQSIARAVYPFVLVLAICNYTFLQDRMWLPREIVTLDGKAMVAGYVLTETATSLRVLRDYDRAVVDIALSDVESREICQAKYETRWWNRTPVSLLRTPPKYRACPQT